MLDVEVLGATAPVDVLVCDALDRDGELTNDEEDEHRQKGPGVLTLRRGLRL